LGQPAGANQWLGRDHIGHQSHELPGLLRRPWDGFRNHVSHYDKRNIAQRQCTESEWGHKGKNVAQVDLPRGGRASVLAVIVLPDTNGMVTCNGKEQKGISGAFPTLRQRLIRE
jgi:hypothetical protein